jgi:predicted Zn-dependent protease
MTTVISSLRMIALITMTAVLTAGCASTTQSGAVGVERKQLLLVSSQEAEQGAATFYAKEKDKYAKAGALNANAQQTARVRSIAAGLIEQAGAFRPDTRNWKWEVNVIHSKEVNAYCAAGGKMAIYTGLLDGLKLTDNEVAAVMGHEIAHALREHTREAMSEALAQQVGLSVLSAALKLGDTSASLLGNATHVALTLPFSREKEREADRIGLELMARAGYNPRDAVSVWRKMMSSGGHPPELLSTHPDPGNRIKDIEAHLPNVIPLYEEATRRKSVR